MANSQGLYQKHHSFKNFSTRLATSQESQRQRVISILKNQQDEYFNLADQKEILISVLNDLEKEASEAHQFNITKHIADELSKIDDKDVCRYVYHRYRYDIFPSLKRLDEFPPCLQIEPTSVCNFRCVFCYQSDTTFSSKGSEHMGSMDLTLFKKIIDQIQGKVEIISLASRGEPMVCRDIIPMLEYCAGKFLGLKVNTNASLLTEKNCHALLAGGVNTVVFSADAAKEPLYSQMRVGGKLDKILKNIKMFNDIKNKHYSQSKIISRVSGVKFSQDQEMESMLELWGELVDQITFVEYNPWENVYESPTNEIVTACSDLWRRMFIWFDGKMNPCDTDYKSTLSSGTFGDKSISELWTSEQYNQLRGQHKNGFRSQCEPCRRCVVV